MPIYDNKSNTNAYLLTAKFDYDQKLLIGNHPISWTGK